MESRIAAVVGAGAFGVPAALELRRRGWAVELLDPGPLPHPLASSTDISKVIRGDYGADELYTLLAQRSLEVWRRWNREMPRPLFHETGFVVMASGPMAPGGFEHDSFHTVARHGFRPERLDAAELARRFPAWNAEAYSDGYFNPCAGWAESGAVVSWLVERARAAGVRLHEGARFAGLLERGSRVAGVRLEGRGPVVADAVIVAAGAWTPTLLPHLGSVMEAVGQPVLHFRPDDPAPYADERFPVWGADISHTGWYGFPATRDGIVKIGSHGPGRSVHPDEPRAVGAGEERRFREFLSGTFPGLATAPLAGSRLCLYCDTLDGDFWIDRDPEREGLVVASGGSGHGFKFAPVLGPIVADVVEGGAVEPARFAWRRPPERKAEAARHRRTE